MVFAQCGIAISTASRNKATSRIVVDVQVQRSQCAQAGRVEWMALAQRVPDDTDRLLKERESHRVIPHVLAQTAEVVQGGGVIRVSFPQRGAVDLHDLAEEG